MCTVFLDVVVIACTSERLEGDFGNVSASTSAAFETDCVGFPNPVAKHFNSASHSLDDIMVCGWKQCSGSNISRKQHEVKLIFKLGTLRHNGLIINLNLISNLSAVSRIL